MLVNKMTLKENLDLRATDNKAQKGYESSVRLSFSQVNLPIVENIVPWECSWSLNYSRFFFDYIIFKGYMHAVLYRLARF